MEAQSDNPFVHRFIADGVIESICMKCFLTVCRCRTEVGIEGREAKHVCQDYLVPGLDSQTLSGDTTPGQ
jgi:hypothetical protein